MDTRLLVTLVALMGQRYPVYVYRFGDAGPGATPGVPMRMMRIAALVQRGPHASSYLHSVLRFLAAQQPPYRASVHVLHLPGAKTVDPDRVRRAQPARAARRTHRNEPRVTSAPAAYRAAVRNYQRGKT